MWKTAFAYRAKLPGMNLVEVIISLGIFSVAMVGIYMGINNMSSAMSEAMARDIESAYANMLLSQVNPYAWKMEVDYDTATSPRASMSLPDGRIIYYTRRVDDAATTGDVKTINVFLYHEATGGTPYRQFRRDVVNPYTFLSLTNAATSTSTPNFRINNGEVWRNISGTITNYYNNSSWARMAGWDVSLTTTGGGLTQVLASPAISPVVDASPWEYCTYAASAPGDMGWSFPATSNMSYTVEIGFSEIEGYAANARKMDVKINGVTVDTVDPIAESGGANLPLVKAYSVSPMLDSGAAVVKVQVVKAAGATQKPMVCWLGIRRN